MTKITYIPGEIANAAIDEHGNRKPVTRTHHIFDDNLEKPQSEVNQDRIEDVATLDGKIALEKQRAEGVESGLNNRLGTVEQLAEISIGGGDAQIATGADFTNPDATKRAKVTTVGAIIDGLNDGVYDVSKRNPSGGPNSDGKFTLEYILNNANTLIPTSWRHGGMSISFVSTYDNKYVQFRCKTQSFSTNPTDWVNVEDHIANFRLVGNDNTLVSGGFYDDIVIGNTYRVFVKNPNISESGVTTSSTAVRFAIRAHKSGGSYSDIVKVVASDLSTPLAPYYDFTIPMDCIRIEAKMRAEQGAVQELVIDDITTIKDFHLFDSMSDLDSATQKGYYFRKSSTENSYFAACYVGTGSSGIIQILVRTNQLPSIAIRKSIDSGTTWSAWTAINMNDDSISAMTGISSVETNKILETITQTILSVSKKGNYKYPLWIQQGTFSPLEVNSTITEADDSKVVRTNPITENIYYVKIPSGYEVKRIKVNASGQIISVSDAYTSDYIEVNSNNARVYDRLIIYKTNDSAITPADAESAGFGCYDNNYTFFESVRTGYVELYNGGVAALRNDAVASVKHYMIFVNNSTSSPNYKSLMWWNGLDWQVRTDYTYDDILNHNLLMPELSIDDNSVSHNKTWSSEKLQEEFICNGAVIGNSVRTGLKKAIALNKDKRYVNILVITDTHANDNNATPSILAAKEIVASGCVDYAIHIGDIISTYDMTKSQILDGLLDYNCQLKGIDKLLFCKGNHDCGHSVPEEGETSENISNNQFRMIFQNHIENAVFNNADSECAYFYFDNEEKKLRTIILDSEYDSTTQLINFGEYQGDWLYNTALDFTGKSGWSVIIFVHYVNETFDRNVPVVNIIKAFANKGTAYGCYAFSSSIDVDLVGVLHGHRHRDMYDDTDNVNYIGVRGGFGDDTNVSIFTIDTTDGILYETEVNGTDREFTFPTASQIENTQFL